MRFYKLLNKQKQSDKYDESIRKFFWARWSKNDRGKAMERWDLLSAIWAGLACQENLQDLLALPVLLDKRPP